MLDMPPPLPRCSRISSVSRTLVRTSNTINVYANHIGMAGVIPLEGHGSGTTIACARAGGAPGHGRTGESRRSVVHTGRNVLLVSDDRRELLGVQAGTAD